MLKSNTLKTTISYIPSISHCYQPEIAYNIFRFEQFGVSSSYIEQATQEKLVL